MRADQREIARRMYQPDLDAMRSHLPDLAAVLVSMEVLTRADLRTLALCCETLATATALEDTIRSEGFTIATTDPH